MSDRLASIEALASKNVKFSSKQIQADKKPAICSFGVEEKTQLANICNGPLVDIVFTFCLIKEERVSTFLLDYFLAALRKSQANKVKLLCKAIRVT